jgi:WD40 repeat protein
MTTRRQRVRAKPDDDTVSATADDNDTSMRAQDYEAQRKARILANEAFLDALGMAQLKTDMSSSADASRASKRAATAAKRRKLKEARDAEPKIQRKSLRQRGKEAPNIQVLVEHAGRIVTTTFDSNAPSSASASSSGGAAVVAQEAPIQQLDAVLFDEEDGDSADEGLRQVLGGLVDDESGLVGTGVKVEDLSEYHQQLAGMTVREDEVEKLTPDAIYGLAVHPSASKLVVMAGDKKGNVGIWAVPNAVPSGCSPSTSGGAKRTKVEQDVNEQQVLVTQFRPHSGNVNVLAVAPEDPMNLLSWSYDGTVKSIDMAANTVTTVFEQSSCVFDGENNAKDVWLQHGAIRPGAPNELGLAFSNGWSAIVDKRSGKPTAEFYLHEQKVQTLSFGGDHYMCTVSRDGRCWLVTRPLALASTLILGTNFRTVYSMAKAGSR